MNGSHVAPAPAGRGPGAAVASAPKTLRRETHQPDYVVLVAVVALSAIGILMVFSASAMKEYQRDGDVFGAVAPQVVWGLLGIVAMLVMSRVDYRRLRLISVPLYLVAVALLVLVFMPSLSVRGRRVRPLAQDRPAADGPPGRARQAGHGHLSRPLAGPAGDRHRAACGGGPSRSW